MSTLPLLLYNMIIPMVIELCMAGSQASNNTFNTYIIAEDVITGPKDESSDIHMMFLVWTPIISIIVIIILCIACCRCIASSKKFNSNSIDSEHDPNNSRKRKATIITDNILHRMGRRKPNQHKLKYRPRGNPQFPAGVQSDSSTLAHVIDENKKANANANEHKEKVLEIVSKKHGKRHVLLYAPIDVYIVSKPGKDGVGLQIESFVDNKYGKAMEYNGVKVGWKVTKLAKEEVMKMSYDIIEGSLVQLYKLSGKNGYNVTFEDVYRTSGPSSDDDIETSEGSAEALDEIDDDADEDTMSMKEKTTREQIIVYLHNKSNDDNEGEQNEHNEGSVEHDDVAENQEEDEEYDSNNSNQFYPYLWAVEKATSYYGLPYDQETKL